MQKVLFIFVWGEGVDNNNHKKLAEAKNEQLELKVTSSQDEVSREESLLQCFLDT
jgi:hypothetical protein